MLQFNKTYFTFTILLFVTEILIALYVHDLFIRPFFGDVLVVILIYCCIKSFVNLKVVPTAFFVLLFAFGVEMLQYFNIVEKLGLQNSKIARIVIGTSFQLEDFLCYTVGIGFVLLVEKTTEKRQ